MGVPAPPNLTGGAGGASGAISGSTDARFGPVSVGGLFGSGAKSSSNDLLVPLLIAGAVLLAFVFLRNK